MQWDAVDIYRVTDDGRISEQWASWLPSAVMRARSRCHTSAKTMSTPDTSTVADSALGHHEPDPRRWQALALVCVAFFMTVLDGTIVTVALPTIKNSLHVSDNTLQWVLIAYTITFGGLLLLGGRAAPACDSAAAAAAPLGSLNATKKLSPWVSPSPPPLSANARRRIR
jgi:hypothetical protein